MAAEAGCIGICFTNAIAGMAPWGGKQPRLGNNPLVISFPYRDKNVLLDMALSQFSYGKMQEYELEHTMLPQFGGYDEEGNPTKDPTVIRKNKSALPIGFWKGSGLALVLDILLTGLGGGLSTAAITKSGKEIGLSQCFICLHPKNFHDTLVEEIFQFTRTDDRGKPATGITYPGERMLATRAQNEREGIPVDESIWKKVMEL
jgi:3-dehydro-L-gulonate 2-dehydrogenase